MLIKPEFHQKDIRSYVIRAGRLTEAQEKGFDLYWAAYGLHLHDGRIDTQAVFGNSHPVILEIGYGMGDSLLSMAEQNPGENYLGIEVHVPGVGRLINEAGKKQLTNLRTYCADANDVLTECIPPSSLARIQVFFPDPWHKKRHHKRRIIQPAFLEVLRDRLEPGGILHLCTDWLPYAEHMLELLEQTPGLENLAGKQAFSDRPAYRPVTRFERRGERLGQPSRDLIFHKVIQTPVVD